MAGFPYTAHAARPEWQEEVGVDVSVYQNVIEIPPVAVIVPTVVTVPLSSIGSTAGYNRGVAVMTKAWDRIDSFVNVKDEYRTVIVSEITGNGTNLMALKDGLLNSVSDFPAEGFVKGGNNQITLLFLFPETIKTSQLHVTPAPNATLPATVMIEMGGDSCGAEDTKVVVSEKALAGWDVHFPEVETYKLIVTFSLTQPLRLSEMEFVQNSKV